MPILNILVAEIKENNNHEILLKEIADSVSKILNVSLEKIQIYLQEIDIKNTIVFGKKNRPSALINITLINGRTNERKKFLMNSLLETFCNLMKIQKNMIKIVFYDVPSENISITDKVSEC